MTVKILLERKFKEDPSLEDIRVINAMRIAAMQRRGYVSGETLVDMDDHKRILVISVWINKSSWDAWLRSGERQRIEASLDKSLKQPPMVRSFMLGADYLSEVFDEVVHESEIS